MEDALEPDSGTAGESDDLAVLFGALPSSPTFRDIFRVVYGSDYPEEADPFSFVTLTDLRNIASNLNVGPEKTIVDLACGRGGPGLWVARETGAALLGFDASKVGIEAAKQRASSFGLANRAKFRVRDAAETGLSETSVDGVMSVDAFWLFPDKARVAAEVARILRPGGGFVFTTWEFEITPVQQAGWAPQLSDHTDLLRDAGFLVATYEETPDWRRRQLAVYDAWLTNESALIAELGDEAASDLLDEARDMPALLERSRRVMVTARKP